jgi:L-ribulose-5-phosphate 3-epimerase
MKRRVFIARSVLVSLGTAGLASACARMTQSTGSNRFEISLAEWSLHRTLRAGQLDHLDFAVAARRDFGLTAVEYVNTFFKDKARDTSYLRELHRRADGAGVRSLLIMCDGEGNLGDVDAGMRAQAVENHYQWVEAARFLGCHSIRVNADSQAASPAEQMKLAADGLRRLAEFGGQQAIDIIVENHGGSSTNGDWLVGVLQMADHPRLGTLPDFGNFQMAGGEWYDRYRGVDQMMPYARGVSAKSHDFDANGNEVITDYRRMMQIVLRHGYRGYVGIEYEGDRLSEADGIRATRDLLLRVRAELSG